MFNRNLLSGAGIDLLFFLVLFYAGMAVPQAQVLSFFAAAGFYFVLNRDAREYATKRSGPGRIYNALEIFGLAAFALALRGGLFLSLLRIFPVSPAVLSPLLPGTALTVAVGGLYLFTHVDAEGYSFPFSRPALVCLPVALLLLRLGYLDLLELLPEEAYYWQYSRHLDIGYLDHPPMVSWLIAAGETIFGHSAFSLRFFGFICWAGAAQFIFAISERIAGRKAAAVALVLFSVLPYFFLDGFFMSPDAPLLFCWTGLLYFLYRAFIEEKRTAWIGVGVFTGLGMLSKYTIALLGLAALVFLLTGRERRAWLARREPYLAGLLALAIFSPVIYWNFIHDWASFTFQSSRRLNSTVRFSLHNLLLNGVYLVSPLGVLATSVIWARLARGKSGDDPQTPGRADVRHFVLLFSLVPISVFALYSLRHVPKINWIGPAFVILLPSISAWILSNRAGSAGWAAGANRWWRATVVLLILFYSLLLEYPAIGLPVVGYPHLRRFVGWHSLAQQAVARAEQLERETGATPIIVGMDKHLIASEVAFYSRYYISGAPYEVAGRNLFNQPALMYAWWSPPEQYAGRNVVMLGKWQKEVTDDIVGAYFERLSPIEKFDTIANGHIVATHFVRVGYGFKPVAATNPSEDTTSSAPEDGSEE